MVTSKRNLLYPGLSCAMLVLSPVTGAAAPAVVVGGGNRSSDTTNLRIEIKASQPFPASGAGWKSGENNDTGVGTTLTSYAICAT